MSTSSIKAAPTLKGLFNDPKPSHRRDFLRENKLSLRELQRITNDKQTELQNSKKQQFFPNKRRSLSQQRSNDGAVLSNGQAQTRSISQKQNVVGLKKNPTSQAHDPKTMSRCPSCCGSGSIRSDMVQKSTASTSSVSKEIQTEDINDEQFLYDALKKCTTYDMKKQMDEPEIESKYYQHDDLAASVASLNINGEKRKEHDTHSIHNGYSQHNYGDQPDYHGQYSHDAASQGGLTARSQASFANLPQHGCSSNELQTMASVRTCAQTGRSADDNHSLRLRQECGGQNFSDGMDGGQMSQRSRNVQRTFSQSHLAGNNYDNELASARSGGGDGGYFDRNNGPATQRSNTSKRTMQSQTQYGNKEDYDFEQRPSNPHEKYHAQNMPQPLSGRSQQSTGTQNTTLTKKKSVASLHRLGSRDDIRLPRYLEREKREKEEQHAREMLRDVNCPQGHYQLNENDRLAALAMAKKKFQDLINELNHMPMTAETLRIRTRKGEIEKELVSIEADIRVFSKPKVYVLNDGYA